MKKYKYTAVNLQKMKFTGTFIAEDEQSLRRSLLEQNLFLVSSKIATDASPNPFFSVSGKVSLGELTSFCRQFSIMANSGIAILECLNILRDQSYGALFKKVLSMIYEDVKVGALLSKAMEKHSKIFPEFFRSMVYVGEVSGQLETVLNKLADYYEKDAAIKHKLKSAMMYPIALGVMLVGVVALMMIFVIPTFRSSLSSLDCDVPQLTQVIYDCSDFLIANGKYILLGVLCLVLFIILFKRTERGKMFFDELALKTPLIKDVQINMLTSKFANGFGLLVSSGLDIVEALEVICNVLGNRYMQKRFRLAIEDVRQGMTMTMAFDNYKLFPQIMLQMLSVGEKSDSIGDVLGRSCNFFDEQVSRSVSGLSAVLQPVMLCLLGATIGIMFAAVYSPMLGIMTSFA